jgi:enediyne biosynthesis protein E5
MDVRDAPSQIFGAVNRDARHWQILALSGLFLISILTTDYGARPIHLVSAFAGTMTAQIIGTALVGGKFEWKSAAITSLSLTILMRAVAPWMWFAAGLIGIGLKFAVRYNGKHIFNPACIAIVAMCLLFDRDVWVSPGQWGQAPLLLGWAAAAAALVLSSARRLDIALSFFGTFAAILIGRAIWLGDPMSIPMHQLSTGTLLVFTFFMITDPRSTPDSRLGRMIFAALVAILSAWFIIVPNVLAAPIMALAALSFLTPVLDRLLPADRFQWGKPSKSKEGRIHETQTPGRSGDARPQLARL